MSLHVINRVTLCRMKHWFLCSCNIACTSNESVVMWEHVIIRDILFTLSLTYNAQLIRLIKLLQEQVILVYLWFVFVLKPVDTPVVLII